jgi:glycosyltransferase involved in cell wall biosynthesis
LGKLKSKNKIDAHFSWDHYGNGKMKDKIIEYSNKNNIPLKVHMGASDEEVQSAIANSSIFVQPSRYEGSSLTTLEAMTHGALIVAMPVGGIPDKIFDKNTGFLCKSVTVPELEKSLSEALNNMPHNEIRDNAEKYVLENFDIAVSTRKYDELYKSIITSKDCR